MEQQSTPWRVFDAPAAGDSADQGPSGSAGPASPAPGLANPVVALAGLAAAALVAGIAIVLAIGGSGGGSVAGPGVSDAPMGSERPLIGGADIVVDVVGAVVRPGVYHLPIGARVGDAITAAGGFGPRVDADAVGTALNLASPLKDGDQVRVPSRDDASPSSGAGGGSAGGGSAGGGSAGGSGSGSGGVPGTVVNLNSATEAELDALPGIGPVTAGKIIESRTQSPFKTVDELRSRGLVGQKTFDQIKAQLTVR
jgi:competence protein ComEA